MLSPTQTETVAMNQKSFSPLPASELLDIVNIFCTVQKRYRTVKVMFAEYEQIFGDPWVTGLVDMAFQLQVLNLEKTYQPMKVSFGFD